MKKNIYLVMCAVKMQKKLSFAFVLIMNEAMQMYKSLQYQQLYDMRSKYWIFKGAA